MPAKEIRAQLPEMGCSTLSLSDAMRTTGISHETEQSPVADQLIDQYLSILVVHIIIRRAMDIQQIPAQMARMGNR